MSNDYWRKRFEQLEEALLNKSTKVYKEIEKQYKIALSRIEKDIYTWYSRFSVNNNLSINGAKKLLKSSELEELLWSVDEYIKYGKENAINQMWIKELENASAKAHITRLEAIKLQIQNHLEVLYSEESKIVEDAMKNIYTEGYYNTIFEISKGIGVSTNFSRLDDNSIKNVIVNPWTNDGINFSERIWDKHRPKLIYELHKELTQNIISGRDPKYSINSISKKFDVSKRQAGNLIITESAFFASKSRKDCFNELDIDNYEIVSTLDLKISNICKELDGKVFDIKDFEVGVTAPPFHNFCRTTTAPFFDDYEEFSQRVARNSKGNVYTVPSNMNYKEWYEKYIKGNIEEELAEKKLKNKSNDEKQHKRYLKELGEMVPKSFDKFQELKYNNTKEWERISYNYKLNTVYNLDRLKNTENFAGMKAIKHILEGEVNKKRGKAVGYHLEHMPFTKAKINESTRSKVNSKGLYSAEIEIDGFQKDKYSTFFPIKWTPQQVINEINYAYLNRKKISKRAPLYEGISRSGIRIHMYIEDSKSGKITTAYPIME